VINSLLPDKVHFLAKQSTNPQSQSTFQLPTADEHDRGIAARQVSSCELQELRSEEQLHKGGTK